MSSKVPAACLLALVAGCGGEAPGSDATSAGAALAPSPAVSSESVGSGGGVAAPTSAVTSAPTPPASRASGALHPSGGATGAANVASGSGADEGPATAPGGGRVDEAVAAAGVPAPAREPLSLAAGTMIPATLDAGLSTRTNTTGDTFHATITAEILAPDGMVLVPEGSKLVGRVAEARQSGSANEEALLVLTFDALLVDGKRVPIDAVVTDAEIDASAQASGGRTAATIATGAAAGAIVGRILGRDTRSTVQGAVVGAAAGTGVALATRDGHATMGQGARVTVRLQSKAPIE